MGLLDRLRTGELELAISLDRDEVLPGSELGVRVDVSGAVDDTLRAITVTLEGEGRYLALRRNTFSDRSEEEEWCVHSLHSETHELPLAVGPSHVRFTVPPDAPPSSDGVVEWVVTARADRVRAKDKVTQAMLSVLLPPDRIPATATGGRPEYAGVRLIELPMVVTNYADVSGTLEVELTEDRVCSDVWVGLERRRTYVGDVVDDLPGSMRIGKFQIGSAQATIEKVDTIDELVLEQKRQFRRDQCERYEFTLELDGSGPTTEHPHGRAEWVVRAVVDRGRRGLNLEVKWPLFVIPEPDED